MRLKLIYKPRYPEVHGVLESHRFCVLAAHRRFGKTVLAVNHLLKSALKCKKAAGVFAYVAPFRNQAKTIAWEYIKHYTQGIPLRGVNEAELSLMLPSGARLRLFGADNPDSLRGMYFDGVVLDEVADMKREVWGEIIQPALTDRRGWALFIGTPHGINLFSELYDFALEAMKEGGAKYDPEWAALKFRVDATGALPEEEVARLKREMSPNAWRQEMLCDFSASSDDILISLDDVDQAMRRRIEETKDSGMPLIMGVDVARFGSDSSVVFLRRGRAVRAPQIFRSLDNMELADRVAEIIRNERPDGVFIDAGQGQGVIDRLRHLNYAVEEIPFGSRALDAARFENRRAEMWYSLREWLKTGGALPDLFELKMELTTPKYFYTSRGCIALERKEDIKQRLGRSPDLGDALALTFAKPVPCRADVFGQGPRKAKSDYDLLSWR